MAEEETITVDQLKKQRVIEHMELIVADLQRFQSSQILINTAIQLHDALVLEYNSLYQPKAEPSAAAEPAEGDKPGKKSGKSESH
jgi:hypothetical protein